MCITKDSKEKIQQIKNIFHAGKKVATTFHFKKVYFENSTLLLMESIPGLCRINRNDFVFCTYSGIYQLWDVSVSIMDKGINSLVILRRK